MNHEIHIVNIHVQYNINCILALRAVTLLLVGGGGVNKVRL